MAMAPAGSDVVAATPLAACANVLRAWAVSLAATPVNSTIHVFGSGSGSVCVCTCVQECLFFLARKKIRKKKQPL